MTVIEQIFTAGTFFVILTKVAPILLAAIGGAFTQQGNILNIGLEGMMLIGAFTAIVVGSAADNALVGVLAAVAAALVLAAIYAVGTLWSRLTTSWSESASTCSLRACRSSCSRSSTVTPARARRAPGSRSLVCRSGPVADIPVLGDVIDDQTPLVWLAFISVPLASLVLFRTRYGVHLRAVGEDEPAALAAGINVRRVKAQSILISGLLCGLAGAQLRWRRWDLHGEHDSGARVHRRGRLNLRAGPAGPDDDRCLHLRRGGRHRRLLGIAGFNSSITLMVPYVVTIIVLSSPASGSADGASRA